MQSLKGSEFTMKRKISVGILMAVACAVSTPVTAATSGNAEKYAVGLQSSFMSGGLSAKMKINDKMSGQAVLGALGTLTSFSGRVLYEVKSDNYWDMYGFGTVGVWVWDGGPYFESETAVGFGGGAGIEWDWRAIAPDLPPLYWSLEAGLGVVNFDNYTGFSTFSLGGGVHYRF